jgi:diguanylate cyclase (GGDEF)-like protein
MDTFHILTFSPKPSLMRKIKDLLSSALGFHVDHVSSLTDALPPDLGKGDWIGIADLRLQSYPLEESVTSIQNLYPDIMFLLLSDEAILSTISLPANITLVNSEILENSLFLPFIKTMVEKARLIKSNLQAEEDLNNRLNELMLIRKASLHLTMNLSLDSVLESILDSAMELVSADDTHVFLYEHGVLSFAAALFDGNQQGKPYMNPRPHGMTYQVAREGTKLVVGDTMANPLFKDRRWEGSIIGLPLKIGNTVLGVMNVALKRAHEFSENEIRILEFLADQASIAIQNAKLYEQAQQEITDRKIAEKAIQHLAHHDSLTGLPNRRLFNERISMEISRSLRNEQKIGVMLFDLDQLKKVNDSFGHSVGDILLQSVAQRLLGLLRKSDTVARMGGDEFLLILPEMKVPKDAILTAERILSALSTPFHIEGYQINISTSIGIVFFPDDGTEVDDLIKKADIAMYKAKEKGGNVYHVYTS